MRADVPRLQAALKGLEECFRKQGAPVGRHLRAGLSDGEMDALTATLPFRLSDELRCFYRWHDGVDELDDPEWPYFHGGGILRPLQGAVDDYVRWRADPSMQTDGAYRPTWFPINRDGNVSIVVDCGVNPGQASPIHVVDIRFGDNEWQVERAPSMLAMVKLWNQMFDDGHYRYDIYEHDWDWGLHGYIPDDIANTGLV